MIEIGQIYKIKRSTLPLEDRNHSKLVKVRHHTDIMSFHAHVEYLSIVHWPGKIRLIGDAGILNERDLVKLSPLELLGASLDENS